MKRHHYYCCHDEVVASSVKLSGLSKNVFCGKGPSDGLVRWLVFGGLGLVKVRSLVIACVQALTASDTPTEVRGGVRSVDQALAAVDTVKATFGYC